MNCVELFLAQAKENPKGNAIWVLGDSKPVTFGDLAEIAAGAQKVLNQNGVGAGDKVLIADPLGPRLYGIVIGILAMGASVVLVEPWMPLANIERVIALAQPKLFLSHFLGKLWGWRVPAIRKIRRHASSGSVKRASGSRLALESVDPDLPGIITFTSGTTGKPKGVVRSQGYLVDQHKVISKNLDHPAGADLCIFANFVFLNLASGRGTVLVPPKWSSAHFNEIKNLPAAWQPESLTCGPAFLLKLMNAKSALGLKSIHVGGALTDCGIFEKGFERWPDASWSHLYGSSEAEPVSTAEAREAVRLSRARGHFQTLYLGRPIPEANSKLETDGLWVAGPHVCPKYLGSEEENRLYKRHDDSGAVWHFMGDRVMADDSGWWYAGRSGQMPQDFDLEQKIYSELESSLSFVHRTKTGDAVLVGEKLKPRISFLLTKFQPLKEVVEARIFRDKRHRARIDRIATLKKGAPWLLG